MPPKRLASSFLPYLVLASLLLLCFYSSFLTSPRPPVPSPISLSSTSCDLFRGKWVYNPSRPKPSYDETCPFHRNAWNCIKNGKSDMGKVNSWEWVPKGCVLERFDARGFLGSMRGRNVGFVGDSLSENLVVALLCALRGAAESGRKWKKKGAWRGGYFPEFNVTVGYHRAVLLAKYRWQPKETVVADDHRSDGFYRVDVDIPADDWASIGEFYDVLIFNTGHWWGPDKFPPDTPLVFYSGGKPILPALDMMDGLEVVLKSMVSYIERSVPKKTLKFWRLQSPRHFYGGEWNQNGSCLFEEPLEESQVCFHALSCNFWRLASLAGFAGNNRSDDVPKLAQLDAWFDPSYDGVNKEARRVNALIMMVLQQTDIQALDFTHLSEFRADAHPSIWLGKKDAVAIWGQDCMHWCLPGVPDTWVDILAQLIRQSMRAGDRANK